MATVFGIQNFLTQGPILYCIVLNILTGPGPGTYMLPPVVGPSTAPNKHKAPQYSIKLPLKHKYNDAPAPGYVPADNKLPAVTVKGRNFYDPSEYQKKTLKTEKREIESYPLPSASTGLVLTRWRWIFILRRSCISFLDLLVTRYLCHIPIMCEPIDIYSISIARLMRRNIDMGRGQIQVHIYRSHD